MERYPTSTDVVYPASLPTGSILVDPAAERIFSMEVSGNAHSIVRALLNAESARGCDLYVSRFPCSLCVKMAVQAGVRKIHYFPSEDWELGNLENDADMTASPLRLSLLPSSAIPWQHLSSSPPAFHSPPKGNENLTSTPPRPETKREKNIKAVQRLISNNPIGLSMYVPYWVGDHATESDSGGMELDEGQTLAWALDDSIASSPAIYPNYGPIKTRFNYTATVLQALQDRYQVPCRKVVGGVDAGVVDASELWKHAMVLAHIASKRTDDPKVGVGAVIISPSGKYVAVGWNGFPRKSAILDYPTGGSDDLLETDDLKYSYSLHAEQNCLLNNRARGLSLEKSVIVTTKMPCDECSPIIRDCGIKTVITNPQRTKRPDDTRGLRYDKINGLMDEIYTFDVK
ncbi:hypothetical protein SmJEL517_g02036 [Synchytrium microbalum]|uniref:Cytidine and dCMP deaminase domain-containing protein 1 n=1 Tax=Synchytrium microbalum TaxID=1806994 RepID=A0A507CC47_9FUNG|nr:uncharacterized protein SmJEL517_g02036 [Synchytrium microbalum]TPX35514.1 hypothetical protein SmJEL517_g02036 [Synchytrium microbalum]